MQKKESEVEKFFQNLHNAHEESWQEEEEEPRKRIAYPSKVKSGAT